MKIVVREGPADLLRKSVIVGTLLDDVVIRRLGHRETNTLWLGLIGSRIFFLSGSELWSFRDRDCFDRSLSRLDCLGLGSLGLSGLRLGNLRLSGLGLSDLRLSGLGLSDLGLSGLRLGNLRLSGLGLSDLRLGSQGLGVSFRMVFRSNWVSSHVIGLLGIRRSCNMWSCFTNYMSRILHTSHRSVIRWHCMSYMRFFDCTHLWYHHLAHNWILVIGLSWQVFFKWMWGFCKGWTHLFLA